MHVTRIAPIALLALLLIAPTAIADDDKPEPTAKERFAAMVKTLPAPDDANAYEFTGNVVFGGQDAGTFRFAATPAKDGENAVWALHDEMKMMGGQFTMLQESVVGQNLDLVRGTATEKRPHATPINRTFERKDKSVTTTQTTEGAEPKTSSVEPPSTCTVGLASLFLIARLGMPEDGKAGTTYAMDVFDAEIGGKEPQLEEGTVTFNGPGEWNGTPAYLVTGTKGDDKKIEIALDPESRDIIGVRVSGAGNPTVELRPDARKEEDEPKGFFDAPAKTNTQVALQAMLGFATADVAIIDRVIHWPSLYATKSDEYRAETDLEAFRKIVGGELKESLKPQVDRKMMEMILPGAESGLAKEELENGNTKIVFPEMFQSLEMEVGEKDGCWYLMKMPNSPK